MTRYPRPSSLSYSFGPGPMTPAVKWIIWANIGAFVATVAYRDLIDVPGLTPADVIQRRWLWQPVTYMFLHAGPRTSCSTCSGSGCSAWSSSGCGARSSSSAITRSPVSARQSRPSSSRCCRSRRRHRHTGRHRRGVRRVVRHSARLRAVFPGAADPDGPALSGSGEVLRDHHRRVPYSRPPAAASRTPRISAA